MIVTPATSRPPGGSSLLVSATITATNPGGSLPTGTVTFTLDGTHGHPGGGGGLALHGHHRSAVTSRPGTHILKATYSGDTYYGTSTSRLVTLTVSKGATAVSISPSTLTPTAGGSMR